MDATDRKNAWMNLEDEFWEIEKRWQWLYKKVKGQLEEIYQKNENQEEIEEKGPRSEKHKQEGGNKNKPISLEEKILALQCSLPNATFIDAFHQYCKDIYGAVQETTKTMCVVKRLMWNTWENDTICESFYDAIQFSHQLLESLSTSWSIAFSLFRARELDLLYRAEKLVNQATNAHQMALKFVLSCWQTYLAAHCHSWTARLNHARTRVKDSGHSVGQMYSKGLVSSHALTVAIARGLQPITAYKIMSAQIEMNSDNELDMNNFFTLFKSPNLNEKMSADTCHKDAERKGDLSLMNMSSEKSDVFVKDEQEDVDEMDDSPTSTTSPTKQEHSVELPLHRGVHKERNGSGNSSQITSREEKLSPLAIDIEFTNDVLFIGAKPCDGGGGGKQLDKRPPGTKIGSGLRNLRCEVNSLYITEQQQQQLRDPANNRNPEVQNPPVVTKPPRQREPEQERMERQKHKKIDESDSVCSKCKCCCDGKRRRLDSMSSSTTSSSTSEESDREYTSQSNCVTVTSNTQPEFKIQEWEALLVDVIDLNKEWKSLSTNLSADSLENKFKSEMNINKEKDKPDLPEADVVELLIQNPDDSPDLNTESFETILGDLIASMNRALNLSSTEIKNQIKTWTEREMKNELKLHFKGFDPNEAILQAKAFLFQMMQSFFAMLLLTAADSKRRMLCYASLLPESIAESRKSAYSLILSREISTDKKGTQESGKRNKSAHSNNQIPSSVSSKSHVVNPHPLCHHLAMALCKAHLLSSKFITLISKAEENADNEQMDM